MTNTIILGLIIAFFASFAIGLFSVNLYVWLGDRAKARAGNASTKASSSPRPVNDNRMAA